MGFRKIPFSQTLPSLYPPSCCSLYGVLICTLNPNLENTASENGLQPTKQFLEMNTFNKNGVDLRMNVFKTYSHYYLQALCKFEKMPNSLLALN